MKLLLDNTDYTSALTAETPPRVMRKLNQPSRLECALLLTPGGPVVPAANARVVLQREDGAKVFTGYLQAIPSHQYLGWGERGPEYRVQLVATSDEALLDRKLLPHRPPFVARTAGSALKQLANDLLPGAFDLTQVSDLDVIPSYASDFQKPWSEHAAEIALRARAAYRAHDGSIVFRAVGDALHSIAESSATFDPDGLKLAAPQRLANDVTILGLTEPRLYVKDYFLGDGLNLQFDLSRNPFTRFTSVLVDEEFEGTSLSPAIWTETDPSNAISVSSGKLVVAGGTGSDGQTLVSAAENIELGGALQIQHGELTFTAASNLTVGGLYNGAVVLANCVAGFRITPSGAQSAIQAFVNGAATGAVITTVAGHRYSLTTRLYAVQAFRRQQSFHSSLHPAGAARGGSVVASDVRVVLEVHDVDPASPGSQGAPSTVLYDAVLSNAPAACTYALLNVLSAQCATSFARLTRSSDAEIRSQVPAQSYRTRLVGSLADGAECQIISTPALAFFSQYPPVAGEKIVVRYRNRSRALARIQDPASVAALAVGSDDGTRALLRTVDAPAPRTSVDCENAALALLDDMSAQAWAGTYSVWSDFLPGGAASDVWPGDAVSVNVPSRAALFSAIVREVEIDCADLAGDGSVYRITFANDAAEPLAFEFSAARLSEALDLTATTATTGTTFIADLPAAEITNATSTTVDIDSGAVPPAGGGIEVRRSDRNWGLEDDRDLIGRFTTQAFTVTRLTRSVDFFLRQYDSSSPPKYSRYSTLLHLDWPLS